VLELLGFQHIAEPLQLKYWGSRHMRHDTYALMMQSCLIYSMAL